MEKYKKEKGDYWLRKKNSKVYWLANDSEKRRRGDFIFSFDKKNIYHLYSDYPDKMTKEEVEFFNKYEPYWSNMDVHNDD